MPFGLGRSSLDDNEDLHFPHYSSASVPLLPLKSLEEDERASSTPGRSKSPSPSDRQRRRSAPNSSAPPNDLSRLFNYGSWANLSQSLKFLGHRRRSGAPARGRPTWRRALRYAVVLAVTPIVLVSFVVLWWGGLPHSFAEIRKFERDLPQHRWEDVEVDAGGELVERNGGGGRVKWEEEAGDGYLRFPDHLWGHGFNNIFEEILLAAQLAHLSNRAYVFEDYVWSHAWFPYTLYDFGLRPTRVPLNALLSGLIAGANVSTSSTPPVHLSVSAKYYEYVCPSSVPETHRLVLSADDAPSFFDGVAQMDWWVDRIKTLGKGKRCVEIKEGEVNGKNGKRLFNFAFFGSRAHISPLVPQLLESPIIKHFSWSRLVDNSVDRTLDVLGLSSTLSSPEINATSETNSNSNSNSDTISGLLAIHLRRGDYSRHCARLAEWESGYMGFNLAEEVKDRLDLEEAIREAKSEGRDVLMIKERRRKRGVMDLKRKTLAENESVGEDGNVGSGEGKERRWWYWEGQAGQRLTNADVRARSHEASGSVSESLKLKYGVHTHSPPLPGYDPSSVSGPKVGGVRIKEELDFESGAMDRQVMVVEDGQRQANGNVKPTTKTNVQLKVASSTRSCKWMWWGSRSRNPKAANSKSPQRSRKEAADVLQQQEEIGDKNTGLSEVSVSAPPLLLDLSVTEESVPRSVGETYDVDLERRGSDPDHKHRAAIEKYYFKHCLPTVEQLVQRASQVRKDWATLIENSSSSPNPITHAAPLTKILLLSNGWPSFLLEVSQALSKDGWTVIDPDEGIRKRVAMSDLDMAVDMALAERAEVFLGNGFSTLSGNVILLRMAAMRDDGEEGNRLL